MPRRFFPAIRGSVKIAALVFVVTALSLIAAPGASRISMGGASRTSAAARFSHAKLSQHVERSSAANADCRRLQFLLRNRAT